MSRCCSGRHLSKLFDSWFGTDFDARWDWDWKRVYEWQEEESNDWEPFVEQPERDRIDKALELWENNSEASIEICRELAAQGSSWAMRSLARRYEDGYGVPVDLGLAESWYRRAILSGSWLATICYARVQAKRNEFWESDWWLQDGVENGWIPAFFWLAFFRNKHSKSRRLDPEIKKLLEHAQAHGHPLAGFYLGSWMMRGKFGFRFIRQGLRKISRDVSNSSDAWEAYKLQSDQPAPLI